MFKFWKSPQRELENMVDDVGIKIDELIQERDQYKREAERLKHLIDKIHGDLSNEEFAIDFNIMRAFSVERNKREDIPCTIIGYLVKDGDNDSVREWYLYCSEKRHHEIIDDFKRFKAVQQ